MDVDPIEAGRVLLVGSPQVGVRCWTLADDGTLGAPCHGGAPWRTGIVRCECRHGGHGRLHRWSSCSCGLYGLRRSRVRSPIAREYFHFESGTTAEFGTAVGAEVVGGVAYWNPRWTITSHGGAGVFNAEYAAVAALTTPDRADGPLRRRIETAAERYGVEIVAPADLPAAVRAWVRRERDAYRP